MVRGSTALVEIRSSVSANVLGAKVVHGLL